MVWNVIIDFAGMQRYSTVVSAGDPRVAQAMAWASWKDSVAHPQRVLRECKGEVTVISTPAAKNPGD